MKYEVLHTCDQLGGRHISEISDGEYDSLSEAESAADELTSNGQCGFVRRSDGAIQAPDGTWITE